MVEQAGQNDLDLNGTPYLGFRLLYQMARAVIHATGPFENIVKVEALFHRLETIRVESHLPQPSGFPIEASMRHLARSMSQCLLMNNNPNHPYQKWATRIPVDVINEGREEEWERSMEIDLPRISFDTDATDLDVPLVETLEHPHPRAFWLVTL